MGEKTTPRTAQAKKKKTTTTQTPKQHPTKNQNQKKKKKIQKESKTKFETKSQNPNQHRTSQHTSITACEFWLGALMLACDAVGATLCMRFFSNSCANFCSRTPILFVRMMLLFSMLAKK
jgi:hypothetical protein